jgi:hypothetical protein
MDIKVKLVDKAAKKALGTERIQERVFIVKLVNDKNDSNRVAGAVGFSTRDHKLYVYKFKACLLVAGGCVNIFRPRSALMHTASAGASEPLESRGSFRTLPPLRVKLTAPVSARLALHETAASGTDPRRLLVFVMEPT